MPYLDNITPATVPTSTSYYWLLAEISLRRLLNRARHAATRLSPGMSSQAAARLASRLQNFEHQLQQWLQCLPPQLAFPVPPDDLPAPGEIELIKLTRERYVEVHELLCRAYLYMCIHCTDLSPLQKLEYGYKASLGLRFNVYRVRTERPFFRHTGSWGACRLRFNHALCLLAAVRGRQLPSMEYVVVPGEWRECVTQVRDRLALWSEQGAGIPELVVLLDWLSV
jgi:hypothetical protein